THQAISGLGPKRLTRFRATSSSRTPFHRRAVADFRPIGYVVEARTVLPVVAAHALVFGRIARLGPGIANVALRWAVTGLAADLHQVRTSRHRLEAARQAVAIGVALLAKRIDVLAAGGKRLPGMRVRRALPGAAIGLVAAQARSVARDPIVFRQWRG